MREGWSFSCGKEVMEINAAEVLKPGIAPWQSFFFVCGAPRKQQHSCSYLVKCGTSNRIRFAGDAAAQKSEQVFLCSSINWKCWSWGEKTKQMHTAHLFLLILCPFLLQKKSFYCFTAASENIWNYTANAKLWLKSLFFPAHGMTSNGFFFHLNKWVVKITSLPKMCVRLVASSALEPSWELGRTESLGTGRMQALIVFQMNIFIYFKSFQPGCILNAVLPREKCWVSAFYLNY